MGIFTFIKNIPRSQEEKKRIQNEKELATYNRRQDKYNDMLRDESQKQKFLNNMNKIKVNTFTKKMVTVILAVCIIDMQLSYLLAFLDKGQVVEGLSNQLCTTILGVAFVYMIRAYFDSKAEHKNLDDEIKSKLKDDICEKIQELFNAADIDIDVEGFIKGEDDNTIHPGLHVNNKDSDEDDE